MKICQKMHISVPKMEFIRNPWTTSARDLSCRHFRVYLPVVHVANYESVLVPHSSLKFNSKFRVWTRNFQLGCRNFEFAEVEISSLNSKFPVGMSKFRVCRSRNFEFELEISSWDVEISSLPKSKFPVWKSKFPVWRSRNFELLVGYIVVPAYWFINHLPKSKFRVWTRNFQLGCRNFQFAEVEISSLNSKFPVGMSKFPVCRSRNFQFEFEISSWDVEISSLPKSKFPVWNSKFPVWNSKFQTQNFELYFRLECGTNTLS